jgi:hypothetical protein
MPSRTLCVLLLGQARRDGTTRSVEDGIPTQSVGTRGERKALDPVLLFVSFVVITS